MSVTSTPTLNLLDLELLYNFTSSTYHTLSGSREIRDVWRHAVVKKALRCDYVMRALLAVSGTHMAHHRPDRKHHYLSHATAHHDIANRAASSLMVDSLSANTEDLWIFSILTVYFALGSPHETDLTSMQPGDNILPDWTFLFEGVRHIFHVLESTSYTGILSPLLHHSDDRQQVMCRSQEVCSDVFHELIGRVNNTVGNEEERRIYRHAIQELQHRLGYMLASRSCDLDLADVFMWHFAVAESFMPLVQQNKQAAIAIYAHSAVLFTSLRWSVWSSSWDTALLSKAWAALDQDHRLWIQWPIKEIGWVAPC